MKRLLLLAALTMTMTTAFSQSGDLCRVVLFGGSSVATSYLPEEQKHDRLLQTRLREAYPGQTVEVENWAAGGEFIARYLLNGAYERQRKDQPGIDLAIIRFGTNDQKRMKADEYYAHMRKLIEIVKQDFPGVKIIMETGMYVDYPLHFSVDRNKTLEPYWEVSRRVAKEDGYPLADYYNAVKKETESGNWDLRIRARTSKEYILDASQDAGKENDPHWFTNFHPNAEGVRIAVDEELKAIKEMFPTRLPTGEVAATRESRDAAYYSQLLDFSKDRLGIAKEANPDKELQEDTSNSNQPKP